MNLLEAYYGTSRLFTAFNITICVHHSSHPHTLHSPVFSIISKATRLSVILILPSYVNLSLFLVCKHILWFTVTSSSKIFCKHAKRFVLTVHYPERLVQHGGGVLPATLQRCCVRPAIHQLQPGALLEPFRSEWSRGALLVVFIHLLSSLLLQWTHYHLQSLHRAGKSKIAFSVFALKAEAARSTPE